MDSLNINKYYARSSSVAGSISEVVGFCSCPNSSSRTMTQGLTQPLREMSTWNVPGGKGRPARKADNLVGTCEPCVVKMLDAGRLRTTWVSTTFYRDNLFALFGGNN
jgi:hypothetical protein